MDLDIVRLDDDPARNAATIDAQVVAVPLRCQVQLIAEFVGHLVDATLGFLDAECMFPGYFQRAAARPGYFWQALR